VRGRVLRQDGDAHTERKRPGRKPRPAERVTVPRSLAGLLSFGAAASVGSLTESREPKGKIGGFDGHAGLKDATLRATGESRRGIKGGATRAGPEAQANIAENGRISPVQLRVDAEIQNDDAGDENAKLFGEPSGKRRTIVAEQGALRGIE
jgi:hypothetical protein